MITGKPLFISDLVQGIDDGMLQKWIRFCQASLQQRLHGHAVPYSTQGHGGQSTEKGIIRSKDFDQRFHRRRIAPKPRAMNGRNPGIDIVITQKIPNRGTRHLAWHTVERPEGGDTGLGCSQFIHVAYPGQGFNRSLDHGGALVGQPIDLRLRPIQFQAARIFGRGCILLLNPIDRSENVGLGDLGGRATDHVPTAGIRHEQAAIRIFDHVGRMKITLIAFKKAARPRSVGRTGSDQPVSGQAPQVEVGAEQIAPHVQRITFGHHDT